VHGGLPRFGGHIALGSLSFFFRRGPRWSSYSDLSVSFADCVGAVTAREAPGAAVIGLDNDFQVLGSPLMP